MTVRVKVSVLTAMMAWTGTNVCALQSTPAVKPTVLAVDSATEIFDTAAGGPRRTNAEQICSLLGELPVEAVAENVTPTWSDYARVAALKPRLVIVHINAFSGPPVGRDSVETLKRLVRTLQMGDAQFIVYSRVDRFNSPRLREYVLGELLQVAPRWQERFKLFEVRGDPRRSFVDPGTVQDLRSAVREILALPAPSAQ